MNPGGGSGADLSRIWAIVPLRGLESAKSRLAELLDAEERRDLVEELLKRTLRATADTEAIERTLVVSPDPEVLSIALAFGAESIQQPSAGLNAGLRLAREVATARGATALLVVPADLPAVSPSSLGAFLGRAFDAARPDRGQPLVVLETDRHGSGTNVLLVSPPDAIEFAFGAGSRQAHRTMTSSAGGHYQEVTGPLSLDLDTADDLILAELTDVAELTDAAESADGTTPAPEDSAAPPEPVPEPLDAV
ncbi:MAG TPA: 2-phospho-L-lactate guanylyltransferase [Candidatus Limnocylindrales bacterium]|jgi:2-phospho-L-lactate guanylyltransferase